MPKIVTASYRNALSLGGLTNKLDTMVDQFLLTTSNVTHNDLHLTGDLIVDGDTLIKGQQTVLLTDIIAIKDNLIEINHENPSTLSQGGIKIHRGENLPAAYFIWDEFTQTPQVGVEGNLQAIATRPLSMMHDGIAIWDNTTQQFRSTDTIHITTTFTNPLSAHQGIFVGAGASKPSIGADTLGNMLLTSHSNVHFALTNPNGRVVLPMNAPLDFGGQASLYSDALGVLHLSATRYRFANQGQIGWNDGNYIVSSLDGNTMRLVAPNIELAASFAINLGVPLNFGTTGGISAEANNVFQFTSSGDIALVPGAGGVVRIPSLSINDNKVQFLSDSAGNFTLQTDGEMTLQPLNDVVIPINKRLVFGTSDRFMRTLSNQLVLSSTSNIVLSATNEVQVSSTLRVSNATTMYESLNDTVIENTAGNIVLKPESVAGYVGVPTNTSFHWSPSEYIESNGSHMMLLSGLDIILSSGRHTVIPQNKLLTFGNVDNGILLDANNQLIIRSSSTTVMEAPLTLKNGIVYYQTGSTITENASTGTLNFASTNAVTSTSPFQISNANVGTTFNTAAFAVAGTVYASKDIVAAENQTVVGTLMAANETFIAQNTTGKAVVHLRNASNTVGSALQMSSQWDTNEHYLIGRGSNVMSGGRALAFTVPSYTQYASTGTRPTVYFGTDASPFFTVNEQSTTVHTPVFVVSSSAVQLTGNLTSTSLTTNTLTVPSSLTATSTAIETLVPVTMKQALSIVSSADASAVMDVTNNQVTLHKLLSATTITATGNVNVQGTLTTADQDIYGTIHMQGNRVTHVGEPTAEDDAVTKAYVDNALQGYSFKASVEAATNADLDMSMPVFNVDNVTLSPGDRVLVKDQQDATENGIYTVQADNTLQRSADFDEGDRVTGPVVFVANGDNWDGKGFIAADNNLLIGTDAINWTSFLGLDKINVTTALGKTGNTLFVLVDNASIETNAQNQLQVASTAFGQGITGGSGALITTSSNQSHVTAVGTLTQGTWQADTIGLQYGGLGLTSVPTGRLLIGNDANALQTTSLIYDEPNNRFGIGTTSPLTALHVVEPTTSALLTLDATNVTAQEVGMVCRQANNTITGRVIMQDDGTLLMSQDVTTTASRIAFATNGGNVRMMVHSTGQVTIGTDSPANTSRLTIAGKTTLQQTVVDGTLTLGTYATLTPHSVQTSALQLETERLHLIAPFSAATESNIGNLTFLSSTTATTIRSTNATSGLPLPLNLAQSPSFVSATAYSAGFHVPHNLLLGGHHTDATTGFSLRLVSNNLEFQPGLSNMLAVFRGATQFQKATQWLSTATPSNVFRAYADADAMYMNTLNSNTMYLRMGIGGAGETIVSLGNKNATDTVTFDPTANGGTRFTVSDDVHYHQRGNMTIYKTVFDNASGGMQGSLSNIGWYYLGLLGVGRTTLQASLDWRISINYDGASNYSPLVTIENRNNASLVIYKIGIAHHVFVYVHNAPIKLTVWEAFSSSYRLDRYEGSALSAPDGTYSGYDGSWTKDFDLVTQQATTNVEFGTITSTSSATLTNITSTGSTTLGGNLLVEGNSTFTGTQHLWSLPIGGNVAQLSSDVATNNTFTLYAPDAASATLVLDRTSRHAHLAVNSLLSLNYPGSLVLSHNTAHANSKIVLQTRATPRMIVGDDGKIDILSTVDTTGVNDGALVVAGGMQVSKTITTLQQMVTPVLILKNIGSGVLTQLATTSAGDFFMNNKRITQLGAPTGDFDAATKLYVDTIAQGMSTKAPVTAASVGNVDVTQQVTTLDGVVLNGGARILLKDQNNPVENGLWETVNGAPPQRASDMAPGSGASGATTMVLQGNVNANAQFMCDTPKGSDIVGINALSFVQTSGLGSISVAPGLTKTGNQIGISVDDYSIEIGLGTLRIKSDTLGQGLSGGSGAPITVDSIAHLSEVGTLTTGVWQASVIDMQYGGTGSAAFSANSIPYSNGLRLTQGPLVFDAVNVRLGINTTTPTHGVTVVDRSLQLTQTAANPCYLITTSTSSNYSFTRRQSGTSLIWASGAGQDPTSLTDRMVLDNTGVLSTNFGLVTPFTTVNSNFRYSGNAIQRLTNGNMNLSLYSADNTGAYMTFYGGLGTFSSTTNSEFLRVGYVNASYIVQTSATGTGSAKNLVLQSGSNTNQMVLAAAGDIALNGPTTVQNTTQSISTTTGALTVAGGVGIAGNVYANALVLSATTDNAIQLGGGLQLSKQLTLSGLVNYTIGSSQDVNALSIKSTAVTTPSYIDIANNDQANDQDVQLRLWGRTTENLTLGYDVNALSYKVMTMKQLSGTVQPLQLGAGTAQMTLDPSNGVIIDSGITAASFLTLSSTLDASSSVSGGTLTVAGGLAVAKSAIIGYGVTTPSVHVTSNMELSDAGSTDRIKIGYGTVGKVHYYNTESTSLYLHGGNSEGPQGTNQEYVMLGYDTSTSYVLKTGKTGAGASTRLILQSGTNANQLVLNTDNTINAQGVMKFQSTEDATNASSGSVQVSGGVSIGKALYVAGGQTLHANTEGTLLNLVSDTATWTWKTDTVRTMLASSSNTDTFSISNSANQHLWQVDQSANEIKATVKYIVEVNDTKALVVRDNGQIEVFTVDTINKLINVGGSRIVNAADPEIATDLATKRYVDNVAKGLNLKSSVAATNLEGQNVNLLNPLLSLDDVSLQPGDRVLLRGQTDPVQNGIYAVQTGNYLVRASDMDNGSRSTGAFTFVERGTVHAERGYVVSTDPPNNLVGTDPVTWTQFNGNVISAGQGLYKDGNNVLHVQIDPDNVIDIGTAGLRLKPSSIGSGLNLSNGVLTAIPPTDLGIVTVGTWRATPIEMAYGGTGSTNFVIGSIPYSNGSALVSDINNFYWHPTKRALGIGTNLPDPNSNNEGLTTTKDIAIYNAEAAVLFGDQATYHWALRRSTDNDFFISRGTSTTRGGLTDAMVVTANGRVGINYLEANTNNIGHTLDVNGTMRITGAVTLDTTLTVANGGTGTTTLAYGLVIANGTDPFASTGTLPDGGVAIGAANGTIVVESGATLRSHIGLSIGQDVQAHHTNLDAISSLTPSANAFIVGNGTAFTTASLSAARAALGLGDLAVLSTINDDLWSGQQLAIEHGGTNATSFTNKAMAYYDGDDTALKSSGMYWDKVGQGVGIGTNVVTATNAVQVYTKDISLQTSDNANVNSGIVFQNVDGQYLWRMRRQDTGQATGAGHLIFSGGVPASSRSSLTNVLSLRSDGQVWVHSTADAVSTSNAALVVAGGMGVTGSIMATTTGTHQLVTSSTNANTPTLTLQSNTAANQSFLGFKDNTGSMQTYFGYDNATTKTILTSISQDLEISAPLTKIMSTVNATNASHGALIVSGGIAVEQAVHIGKEISSTVTATRGAFLTVANDATFITTTPSNDSTDNWSCTYLGQPNLDAENADVTYPTATTLTIAGHPKVSDTTTTNPTIVSALALHVVQGDTRLGGKLLIEDTTQSSSTTTGAVSLAGGMGIGKNLTVGGSIYTASSTVSMIRYVQAERFTTSSTTIATTVADGTLLKIEPSVVSDTSTPELTTVPYVSLNTLGAPTLEAVNDNVTYTKASTLHIKGEPVEGTNVTIASARALHVEQGVSELGGQLVVTDSTESNNLGEGSIVTSGGMSVAKSVRIGEDMFVTGRLYATGNLGAPMPVPTTFVNTSAVTVRQTRLEWQSATQLKWTAVFEVVPQSDNVQVSFMVPLPEKTNDFENDYDLMGLTDGWCIKNSSPTKVFNTMVIPNMTSTTAKVFFESAGTTAHYISVSVEYSV